MTERYVTALRLEDVGAEEPFATRERLRGRFPPGTTRRMTQLGLLVGSALLELDPGENDALVYASGYAETRALESFLDSFPSPSPTLFQTSIHPSAVQQALIGRQQPVKVFLPMTGGDHLVAQALTTCLLELERRVILCGGEEVGTWLLEQGVASDRAFAFALALVREPAGAIARIIPDIRDAKASMPSLPLASFMDHLVARRDFILTTPGGPALGWKWL